MIRTKIEHINLLSIFINYLILNLDMDHKAEPDLRFK